MKIVEKLGNGTFREKDTNAPAQETVNARFEQVGGFRQDNILHSQGLTSGKYQALDATAAPLFVAGKAGTIVGLSITLSAAIATLGSIIAQAGVNGVVVGEQLIVTAASALDHKTLLFATPVAFAANSQLALAFDGSADLNPETVDVTAWLLVRWSETDA